MLISFTDRGLGAVVRVFTNHKAIFPVREERPTENIFESPENVLNGICSPSPVREVFNSRSASRHEPGRPGSTRNEVRKLQSMLISFTDRGLRAVVRVFTNHKALFPVREDTNRGFREALAMKSINYNQC